MKAAITLAVAFLALAPTVALAETQEEQQACMNDAFNICSHAIPDRERVFVCFQANMSRLSAPCRAVMVRYSKPAANPKSRVTSVR
jgi:hypothetical protein